MKVVAIMALLAIGAMWLLGEWANENAARVEAECAALGAVPVTHHLSGGHVCVRPAK